MGIKENYVIDKHPYRISKQKSGRWKTYIKDDLKGRKAIERNEKKDLIDFLYNHYYAEEKTAQSMAAVFEAFLAYKLDCESRSPETCERLRYTYKKFIKDTLGKRKMSGITKNELTAYVQSIIIEKRPRERELKSFLQMLHGLFRFAYMNRYIHEDVSALIRADNYYKDCDCSKKDASQKIFTRNEILRIKKNSKAKFQIHALMQFCWLSRPECGPASSVPSSGRISVPGTFIFTASNSFGQITESAKASTKSPTQRMSAGTHTVADTFL